MGLLLYFTVLTWLFWPLIINQAVRPISPRQQLDHYFADAMLGQCREIPANVACAFKWYGKLLTTLLNYQQKLGISLVKEIKWLRIEFQQEYARVEQLKGLLVTSYLQQLMVIALVWGMSLFSAWIFKINFEFDYWLTLILIQSAGLISFALSYLLLKHYLIAPFEMPIQILLNLKAHFLTHVELNKIMQMHGMEHFLNRPHRYFLQVSEKLKLALKRARERGGGVVDEIEFMTEEVRFSYSEKYKTFQKLTEASKLVHLVFFQLLCYFFYLMKITSTLTKSPF
jgi:hypothetical protein